MIGVSPAYFLSRSGPTFGPRETLVGLPLLAKLGYGGYQAEVFQEERMEDWDSRSTQALLSKADSLGLRCTAFVAHFMGSRFASETALLQGFDKDIALRALALGAELCPGGIFALPLPSLSAPGPSAARDRARKNDLKPVLRESLLQLLNLAMAKGLSLGLELMPGNALGGSQDFLALCEEPGFAGLGLVFDTGHFWAMGEAPQRLPSLLGRRIVATHLCDNDGIHNLSLCPGDGSIAFQATIDGLIENGYMGSLDIEIVCAREQVKQEYGKALVIMDNLSAGSPRFSGYKALS